MNSLRASKIRILGLLGFATLLLGVGVLLQEAAVLKRRPRPTEAVDGPFYVAPLALPPFLVNSVPPAISVDMTREVEPGCVKQWRDIAATDLTTALKQSREGGSLRLDMNRALPAYKAIAGIVAFDGCAKLNKIHPLALAHDEMARNCPAGIVGAVSRGVKEPIDGASGTRVARCLYDFIRYRLRIVEQFAENVPVNTLTDSALLSSLYFSASLREGGPHIPKMIAAAERLVELTPQSPSAAEFLLKARYLDYASRTQEPAIAGRERALEEALQLAARLTPDSETALEVRLNVARLTGEPGVMRVAAISLRQEFPNSSLPLYYLAWASHLENQRDAAVDYLTQISTLGRENATTNETLFRLAPDFNSNPGDSPDHSSGLPADQVASPFTESSTLVRISVEREVRAAASQTEVEEPHEHQ